MWVAGHSRFPMTKSEEQNSESMAGENNWSMPAASMRFLTPLSSKMSPVMTMVVLSCAQIVCKAAGVPLIQTISARMPSLLFINGRLASGTIEELFVVFKFFGYRNRDFLHP